MYIYDNDYDVDDVDCDNGGYFADVDVINNDTRDDFDDVNMDDFDDVKMDDTPNNRKEGKHLKGAGSNCHQEN